jgi:uncharacterized protein YqcC (DUF446 family)
VQTSESSSEVYGEIADQIEADLRAIGAWGSPAPTVPVTSAFGAPELSFTQWLEHVLCARLREVGAGHGEPPSQSQVATRAARELDGVEGSEPLIETLRRLDSITNS